MACAACEAPFGGSNDELAVLTLAYEALASDASRPLAVSTVPPDRSEQGRSNHAMRIDWPTYSVFEVPASLFAAYDSVANDPPEPLGDEFFAETQATRYFGADSSQVVVVGEHYIRAADSVRVNPVWLDHPIIRGNLALVAWSMRCDTYLCFDSGFVSLRRGHDGWEVIAHGITFFT